MPFPEPSMVLNLKAEYVTMTSVNLTWMVNDAESASYTYRIEVAHESLINETMSNVTKSIVTYLIPGTTYNFTVFAIAADNQTEGEGASISQNTGKWLFFAVVLLVDYVLLRRSFAYILPTYLSSEILLRAQVLHVPCLLSEISVWVGVLCFHLLFLVSGGLRSLFWRAPTQSALFGK